MAELNRSYMNFSIDRGALSRAHQSFRKCFRCFSLTVQGNTAVRPMPRVADRGPVGLIHRDFISLQAQHLSDPTELFSIRADAGAFN